MAVHVGGLGADVDHDALRLHRLAQDGGRQQPAQVQPVALHLAERQACVVGVRFRFRTARGSSPRRYSRSRSTSLNARPAWLGSGLGLQAEVASHHGPPSCVRCLRPAARSKRKGCAPDRLSK